MTRHLFRQLSSTIDLRDSIWESEPDFNNETYVERLLNGLLTEQHSAQPDFDLVNRLSVRALEDLLTIKRANRDPRSRVVLDFIHFELCILPLGLAAVRRRLEMMFVWIARSLLEEVEIGMIVDVDSTVFAARVNPANSPIACRHGKLAALEWLKLLYYYSRVTGGYLQLAEALEFAALKLSSEALPSEPAIETTASVLSWSVRAGRSFPMVLITTLRSIYENRRCREEVHKMLGMTFAFDDIPGLPLDKRREAARVLAEHARDLGGHETLQLLVVLIGSDIQEAEKQWSHVRDELTRYNATLRSLEPNPLIRSYEKERLFHVVAPLLATLIKAERVHLALELLHQWTEDSISVSDLNLLFVMPTFIDGVTYASAGKQVKLPKVDEGASLRRLIEAANRFYGINIVLNGDKECGNHSPDRLGVPASDPERNNEFYSSVIGHYGVVSAAEFIRAAYRQQLCMRQVPSLPVPLQAIMVKELGGSFPISLSLKKPLPDRAIRKVLIWAAGSFQAQRQSGWMKEILERSGAEVVQEDGSGGTSFAHLYASHTFDALWLLGHGEFSYETPHQSAFQLGPDEYASLATWATWDVPRTDQRRLLVLDLCDSGTMATLNGPGKIGLAAITAMPEQAVIGNQWPVVQFPSLVFSLFLAHHLTTFDYFKAYVVSIQQMAEGPESIRAALARFLGEKHDSIRAFDRLSIDWNALLYWGAPAFYA